MSRGGCRFEVICPAPPCAVVDTFRPTEEEEEDALPLARWKASASGGSFIPLLRVSGARGRRSLVRSTGRAPRTADGAPDRRSETGREDDLLCSRCKCNETRRSVGRSVVLCVEGTRSARLLSVGAYEGRRKGVNVQRVVKAVGQCS